MCSRVAVVVVDVIVAIVLPRCLSANECYTHTNNSWPQLPLPSMHTRLSRNKWYKKEIWKPNTLPVIAQRHRNQTRNHTETSGNWVRHIGNGIGPSATEATKETKTRAKIVPINVHQNIITKRSRVRDNRRYVRDLFVLLCFRLHITIFPIFVVRRRRRRRVHFSFYEWLCQLWVCASALARSTHRIAITIVCATTNIKHFFDFVLFHLFEPYEQLTRLHGIGGTIYKYKKKSEERKENEKSYARKTKQKHQQWAKREEEEEDETNQKKCEAVHASPSSCEHRKMPCHNQQKSFLFYSAHIYTTHLPPSRNCRQPCEQFQRPTKQQQ